MAEYIIPESDYININTAFPEGHSFVFSLQDCHALPDGTKIFESNSAAGYNFDYNTIFVNLFGVTLAQYLLSRTTRYAKTPKIYNYVEYNNIDKHFHDIDYVIEVQTTFYPKRTMVKGEVQRVEWYSDVNLTDKVVQVDVSYIRDAFGFALNRTTTRRWYCNDGTEHSNHKITLKNYTINSIEQIAEGKRRRGNIVDGFQIPILGMMLEVLMSQGKTKAEVIMMVRDYLDKHESNFNKFVDNASTVNDSQDPNYGRINIVVLIEKDPETWLDLYPPSLGGGVSIRNFLMDQFAI